MAQCLAEATRRLRAAGVPEPEAEAELLLASILETDRGGILARRRDTLTGTVLAAYDSCVARRVSRVPFHYIVGEREFRGLRIGVDPRVLIPRPETEDVVEAALKLPLPDGGRVVDLGTGSGCIAIAIGAERPDLEVFGLDLSEAALEVAGGNQLLALQGASVEWVMGDMADPPAEWKGTMHLVISNPPYVSQGDWERLEPEVRGHEPKAALVPGPSGLEMYEALAPAAYDLLVPGGWLVLELGYDSEAGARSAVGAAGFGEVEVRPDMQGIPRVLVARRPER